MTTLVWMILVGFLGFAVRRKHRDSPRLEQIQTSYLKLGLPLLLLVATALKRIDLLDSLLSAGFYYASASLFMLGTFAVFRWRVRELDASVAALTAAFGNTVMVGIPLFEAVAARDVLELMYLVIPLHALVLFSVATGLSALAGRAHGAGRLALRLPNVTYALVLGVILGVLIEHQAGYDAIRGKVVGIMQFATFFVLGLAVGGVQPRRHRSSVLLGLTAAKLLVMPAFVYAAFRLLGAGDARGACLVAALPVGVNVLGYAATFEDESTGYVSQAILYTTGGAFVTLVALLALFGYL